MSFHQNGSRRYGHVPPAQWSSAAGSGQDASQGLHRQSSFDNGDDSSFHDTQNGRRQAPPAPLQSRSRAGSAAQQGQDLRSPTYGPYGSNSPALSGFQHQYQPLQASGSPPASQIVYNPQQFARTQSQSQAHAPPAPPGPYSPQLSSSNSLNRGAHAPYNPAAYQPQPSLQRQPTNTGYGYGAGGVYVSSSSLPQPPQSPTHWQQNSAYPTISSRPSSRQTYEQPLQSPQYPPSSSAPLPPRASPYTPPSAFPSNDTPYPSDGYRSPTSVQPQYEAYPSPERINSPGNPNGYSSRVSASSNQSFQRMPSPSVHSLDSVAGLQRHPTLRPLPNAPTDNDTYDILDSYSNHDESDEELAQERIYQDIEAAVSLGGSNARTGRPQGLHGTEDLLDGELYRYNSATTLGGAGRQNESGASSTVLADQEPVYDFDDYESDAEAAAGLEAMRIAEEQDAQRGVGSFGVFGSQRASKVPSREASSDSDYGNVDMGLYGGGYDAHLSYGGVDSVLSPDHESEMTDQSRPLPNVNDFRRSEGHDPPAGLGGMSEYSMPGESSLHPFPSFGPARVDTFGTGGLQRPGSHNRKLSFDDGDEMGSIDSHRTESRLSARSGSESPSKDDIPDMFYHPGMSSGGSQRPLPTIPLAEKPKVSIPSTGAYRNSYPDQSSLEQDSTPVSLYSSQGSESYLPQLAINSNVQYVPRSTSLNSHSNTPVTVPPVRSKTDAEERQARARLQKQMARRSGGGLDSFDGGSPQIALDLPVLPSGKRKKINPSKLSSSDYKKCTEPWALSNIAAWLKEMGGGETGEGEADLREKTIAEALVALFTYKVPTMNTADAETLSDRTVKSMFDAGVLVRDEEWVKFGQGEICGVMWQLTGSGCYSPKLHEQEMPGRCYSHHCHRTLKKVNLQAQSLEPTRKSQDWVTFFKMTKEQLTGVGKKEVERQNNLHEIVMSEDVYMDQVNVLRVLYRDALQTWQPPIIGPNKIQKFINNVFGKIEAIKKVNEDHLLAQLKYRQQEQGPWVVGFSDIFREWIRKARTAYIEYAAGFPHATFLVRKEADKNLLFRQFLDQARAHELSGRLDWNTYLKAPITRLQRYSLLLATVHKNMVQDSEEKTNLSVAIDEIKTVTLECDAKVDEMSKKVEMIEMGSKLILRPGMERVELNLDHLGRELIFKGDLQRVGANRFTWLETHAILFDHYLVLAKTITNRDSSGTGRKGERYDVSKLPIPMQLLVLESTDDDPVVKSSVKGLGAVTTVTRNAAPSPAEQRLNRSNTMAQGNQLEHTTTNASTASSGSVSRVVTSTNLEQDARSMYPFRVKHLGKSEVYTLYAPSAKNRQNWCDKIIEAKTRYAASLFRQNAEPFRLRVMADSAFAYDAMSAATRTNDISISGTPLDRAIEEVGDVYGRGGPRPAPVCRAMVNCATAFTAYGRSMVAIGTDYGVFTSEANNPRGWQRSIMSNRVTQIAVLEEFSLFLIIADRSLIAYHLDVVVPPSDFPAPQHDSARRAPQKLSGTREVSFFATARMKDRTLVFYKKRESLHSVFKVLEPVFQKSSEKKSRLFGKRFGGGGTTEFFREFDEFYIPAECFTINLFNAYIAISTQRGFELLTLDKKVPMSIPDLKSPEISSIAARLAGQKPLGMFRLSDQEFLLCYEECGVYIDKHGDVSRSVILEFVGKAKTAAMYGAYLVLFDSDFVEVRNAENGRLRQIVAGKDVRCLDYGLSVGGQGTERTLKVAMAHPDYAGSQLVLEMVLNEGQRD